MNIFYANDSFYLQTIGHAMGGALSRTLANIYLGILEREVLRNENILLFNRYMDDILLIRKCNIYILLHISCLHNYLQEEEELDLEILPLGSMKKYQVESLLMKNVSIYYQIHITKDRKKKNIVEFIGFFNGQVKFMD